jgi:hypothetical protein
MVDNSSPQTGQEQARLLTRSGIEAFKAGRREDARNLLSRAVRSDPHSEQAWLWLAGTVDDPAHQRDCLERVLAINPASQPARRGLAALAAVPPKAAPVATPESPAPDAVSPPGLPAPGVADQAPAREKRAADVPHQQSPALPARPAGASAPVDLPRLAPPRERSVVLVPAQPWLSIIVNPRWTIGRLARADPDRDVPAIAIIVGYGMWLAIERYLGSGDHLAPHEILGFGLLVGPILGLLLLYLGSKLLTLSGGWLGGRASHRDVRTALGWAATPLVWAQLLWLPLIVIQGSNVFRSTAGGNLLSPGLQAFFLTLVAGCLLWALGLLLIGLSEVQQFALWRAAASLLLGILVLFGPILVVMLGAVTVISLRGG